MSKFVLLDDVQVTQFDWGSAGMRCDPPSTGCSSFLVMDVTLTAGACHAFHKHPDQDEMIIVLRGKIVQYLDEDRVELGPGDSVYIDKDVVHGSYNDFEDTADLQVILAPPMGDGGYELVDVSGDDPWSSVR